MTDHPIAYEVTALVDENLRASFEGYMLERHIQDVLATGYFTEASFECAESGRYRMRYLARNRSGLDSYLSDESPRLRADFQEHFPQGVELSREEWIVVRTFA